MKKIEIDKCHYCGSTNIGVGYQLGNGQLYADPYAYHSASACTPIETLLCKECGSILYSRVSRTDIFENAGTARGEELLDYINENGFLFMNENPDFPSVSGLGYSMQNITYLIEQHQVFYCKAFAKKAIYLSVRAYQLLKRCKNIRPLTNEAAIVLEAIKSRECADKNELKKELSMDTRSYNKAFDFLLENLYITACAG